jgi:hypothetical protein
MKHRKKGSPFWIFRREQLTMRPMIRCTWFFLALLCLGHHPLRAADVISTGSSWRFLRGTNEASLPDTTQWRRLTFNDSTFANAPGPFWYGDAYPGGTVLTGMQNVYTCIYLRKTFVISNLADLASLQLGAFCDDGFIAWINGVEVVRYNVAAGEPTRSTLAIAAAPEPPPFNTYSIPSPATLLINGTNVLAIQVFNATLASSDLGFDCALSAVSDDPPVVTDLFPPAGSIVPQLRQIDVVFSENVTGVEAADLRINGSPATNVLSTSPRDYRFQFPTPPTGTVDVAWVSGHGIRDLAASPHSFAGGSWTYQLDPNAPPPTLVINEFLANNEKGTNDIDGSSSDWIEILNSSGTVASMAGWFLSDDPLNPTKWRFPGVNLGPNGYLLVWASEKNRTNPAAQLHTNFKLDQAGEFLGLFDPNTNLVSAFSPIYPPQQTDISFGRVVGSPNLTGYFATPTPGRQNSTSGPGFSPEVKFTPTGGAMANTITVALTAGPGVPVRYTLDGSEPTASSPLYSTAISVANSTVIKARAFQAGLIPGSTGVQTYTILNTDMLAFTSPLPLVVIDAFGNTAINNNDGVKRPVSMTFIETAGTNGRSHILGPVQAQVRAGIEVRGSSSSGFAKKSYSVELRDGAGDDAPASLLGMPSESDWVLYAPYTDKTFMNDYLAYELHEAMGHYAVRRRHVEVFLDQSGGRLSYADYIGVYVLLEKIKIDKNRVDIAPLTAQTVTEPDISGGYILKRDRLEDADDVAVSANNGFGSTITLGIEDPKKHELSQAQINWIQTWLGQLGAALAPANFATTKAYTNYLDSDSFIDNQWIVEFPKNIDGYRLSNFLHKERNGRLKMDPIWDWNLSFGNADYLDGESTANWYYPNVGDPDYPWMRRLFLDPDFNQRYIDRWGELRTNIFAPAPLHARIDRLATRLSEPAGRDYQRWPRMGQYIWPNPPGIVPITTFAGMTTWMKNWVSNRFNWIDTQFVRPPVLSHPGGNINAGLNVSLTASAGTIYYMIDGTDPRLPGGNLSASARTYTGPVTITTNSRIFARARNGTAWSPPAAATYVVATPLLRITEVHYHPPAPGAGNTNDADNYEFIEVKNVGTTALNVSRFHLRGGVDFEFPNTTLAPGESAVVVRHAAAFTARYGPGPRVLGTYTGQLDNAGERLILEGSVGEPILDFEYHDGWFPQTDGLGFSLVVLNPLAATGQWPLSRAWRASAQPGGSPGTDDTVPPGIPAIVINEVLTHTDLPAVDQIELFNPTAAPVDLGGWFLTDDFSAPTKFRIPPGTVIGPNDYRAFSEADFNTGADGNTAFSLSSRGDEIYLFSGDATTNLTGYFHGFDFGAQMNGVTFGRYVTSSGNDQFVSQLASSLGANNPGPLVGPIVISEIMYHPPDRTVLGYVLDNTDDEYIELQNITAAPAPLFHPEFPANTWRLRDAVDFRFPTNVTLAAGAYLLVVGFDPADATQLAAFRSRNGVAASVPVFGPFDGKLDNSSDRVELVRPDRPQVAPEPDAGVVPYVLVDKVAYEDVLPWPPAGDGFGPSLQRLATAAYGNDPTNWTAAAKSPGRTFAGGNPPVITQQPTNRTVFVSSTVTLAVEVSGTGPFSYQWRYDGANLSGATNATLLLTNIQQIQSGPYQVIVLNAAGSAATTPAIVTVIVGATFAQQPKPVTLRGSTNLLNYGETGSNATFSVIVSGTPPISYQWRFKGAPIPGATNPSLTINNVTLAHDGPYDVVVRDAASELTSFTVLLNVLVAPLLTQGPPNVEVTEGANVHLSAEMRGNPAPYTFSWRRISPPEIFADHHQPIPRDFLTLNTTASGLTLAPSLLSTNIACRLVISNSASSGLGTAQGFTITVLADRDADGMADEWEVSQGFNPASGTDASLDTDGDGLSNRAEFIAGTDPHDPNSYLRVDPDIGAGAAAIEFTAISNRTYTVEFTEQLGTGLWQKLADVLSRSSNSVQRIADPAWTDERFYRVLTPYRP